VTRDLVTAGLLLVLLGLLVLINLALLERAWRRIRHGATLPSGHVLIQSPTGTAMVPSGATVSLALGAGEPEIDQPGEHGKRAPKGVLPGVDAPGVHETRTVQSDGTEDIERRSLDRIHKVFDSETGKGTEAEVVFDPDADWPNQLERIRHGVRLSIQRPKGDRGRIASCTVTRVADGRTFTHRPGDMGALGASSTAFLGLDTSAYQIDFPHDFRPRAIPPAPGDYTYRWTAQYAANPLIDSVEDEVATGGFSI
jgi:hypothetical protein